MAGHSKWANTKHRKAAQDAKRNKAFSNIAKDIMIAAKSGSDPEANPRLRTCIQKARLVNMPGDRIKAAIAKGSGDTGGVVMEELVYEGYAAGGVGFIVEVTTDNKNRSASDVRSTFTKFSGELAKPGALMFNFQHRGQFLISADKVPSEDALMEIALDAGADDVRNNGDHFEILCGIHSYDTVSRILEEKGIVPDSSELAYLPNNHTAVTDPDVIRQILRLEERLDEIDDVKAVWTNYDIPAELMPQ